MIIRSLQLILPDLLPAFVISVSLLLIVYFWCYKIDKNWRNAKLFSISNLSYKYRVVFSVLGIGWIFWLLGAVAGSLNDSPREGYIIYIGLALLFGILITDLSKKIKLPNKRTVYVYVVVLLFVITLGMLISAFNSIYTNYVFGVYGSTNPIYNTVENTLAADGLSNCSVISNDWVYLIYAEMNAKYTSRIMVHYPYSYNSTEERYPIVYFTDLGANNSAVNFKNVTKRLNYTDFYIAFPRNWTCVN